MSDTNKTKQILFTRRSPTYWRVTINHPPLNIFGPDTIPQLNEVISAIETDEQLKVVVFDSAIPGFFLTHYDFLAKMLARAYIFRHWRQLFGRDLRLDDDIGAVRSLRVE